MNRYVSTVGILDSLFLPRFPSSLGSFILLLSIPLYPYVSPSFISLDSITHTIFLY